MEEKKKESMLMRQIFQLGLELSKARIVEVFVSYYGHANALQCYVYPVDTDYNVDCEYLYSMWADRFEAQGMMAALEEILAKLREIKKSATLEGKQ